ncbi:MAG: hypothetical protein KDC18_15705 [Alphaproteobacteria bacterium]|nr:hypothetical protein [Alphaproteobacteria bacterium]MCB9928882.1 hypothetical protein [Alphaproteobacteria bacterium]
MADPDPEQPWQSLAARLPTLVHGQFALYRRLMRLETAEDDGPREVTAWENARKAALAHLQALIRVHDLVQARLTATGGSEPPDLDRMLAGIREELAESRDGEGEPEP